MRISEYGSDFHYCRFNDNYYSKVSFPVGSMLFGCGRYAINHLISYHVKNGLWQNIYIPEYFCYEVIKAINKTGISITFYKDYPLANDDAIVSKITFKTGDVLLRMNYFGMRSFRDNSNLKVPVIEDHTHSLFSDWANRSNADWCVASLRKTLPIPDGGIIWSSKNNLDLTIPNQTEEHKILSEKRLDAMIKKSEYLENSNVESKTQYLNLFRVTEESFGANDIASISSISNGIIQNLPNNLDNLKSKNYKLLLSLLNLNRVSVINTENSKVPFSLILFFESKQERDGIRSYLIKNNIYPVILWKIENEYAASEIIDFSEKMLSIPIDFRYSEKEIIEMSKIINNGIRKLNYDI